ncbi:MAG: hypothetical protein JNL18_10350 [Planctomycetaceae bacterium]|uniref:Uncharacterized protein n=1 Tax=Lacipirellula limnantheis TaxID=2528024 RepID=A0A517TV38_9BACT|nr:hypothetical protein [Lacipirellula limnantheis]MBL9163124.1 hypothetical protein [Planctomycetaceae bacterium]QDT72217.1 hypothetical protein I41_13870 [Lacipirellula limnantheis]
MAERGDIATRFKPGNKAAVGHGPPLGSANGFKHGLRAERAFATGVLPKKHAWIGSRVTVLRKALERAVVERHNELSLKHALLIQSACRHEQAALLAQRALRVDGDKMSVTDRLSYLTTIAAESDKRDRAVEKLNLDPADSGSVLDQLYAAPVTNLPAEPEGGDDGR